MQIHVCDDEVKVLEELAFTLQEIFDRKCIKVNIEKSNCPEDVIKENKSYDMAFLDIEMGEKSGLQVAEAILDKNPGCFVFFITNYSAYIDDAFDIKAFRYLNKPVDKERLESSVCKALCRIEEKNKTISLTRKNKRKAEVVVNSVLYIENSNRHTLVVTREEEFLAEESFSVVKAMIEEESDSFALTHQSFFVNLGYVSYYDNKVVKLTHKEKEYGVHMSRRKYAPFEDKMFLEANRQR